jgi:hypothetical protein
VAIDDPGLKIPILRVMLPTRAALVKMHTFGKVHGIERKALGERSKPTPTQASLMADPGWVLPSYREKLVQLGGAGSGNFGHAGRPGEVGGSAPGDGGGTQPMGVPRAASNSTVESVTKHVETVATRMGFEASFVDVVDIEPRTFEVAGRQLREGGHFSPDTGRIEINVRTNPSDIPAIQGLIAHEIIHAMEDTANKAVAVEHKEVQTLLRSDERDYARLFGRSGFPRDRAIPEIEKRWPVSAAMAKTAPHGDSYLGTWSQREDGKWAFDETAHRTRGEQMQKDDGFTAYSRLYWAQTKQSFTSEYWRSLQETVAEVGAYHDRAPRGPWKEGVPSKSWQAYADTLRTVYPVALDKAYPIGTTVKK